MNNKLILTSLLAMAVVSPAVGVSFTGTMETNKTYENAATETNLGRDSGDVTAEAYYTIYPGYYLPANSYTPATCTAGNYCDGLSEVTKKSTAQGLAQCPTGYTSSDSAANSIADCFTSSCTVGSGRTYYGNLNNCTPSSCDSGYTMVDINASTKFSSTSTRYAWVTGFSANSSIASIRSSTDFNNKYGDPNSAADFAEGIGVENGDMWWIDFNDGMLYGGARLGGHYSASSTEPVVPIDAIPDKDNAPMCYCYLTGFKPNDSVYRREMRSLAVPLYSVGVTTVDSAALHTCAEKCAELIATTDGSDTTLLTYKEKSSILEHASNNNKCMPAPYTITYACGTNASGTPGTQSVEYLAHYNPKAGSVCTKTGYTFNNWGVSAPGSGAATVAADTILPYAYYANETYTANWNVNHYNIVYNANVTGATGTTASNTNVAYDANQTLTDNGFTYGFRRFDGWARSSTATTKEFDNKATVSKLSATDGATVNLYAVWGMCQACNVDKTKVDCTLTAPKGVCTYTTSCKPGYGGMLNGGEYNASCHGNTISIGYANGGHGSAPAQTTCTYGETFTLPAALTEVGYTFDKWSVKGKTFNAGANIICNYDNLGVYDSTLTQPGGNAVTITGTWITNTINIIWTRIESASVQTADNKAMTNFDSTNNTAKSQVDYNGSIFTPKSVMEVTGQKFVGWKFVK